jgi:DNA-binding XRE family transcriptional regulator
MNMTRPQIIRTESGEELVVLPRRDYDAILARLGDDAAEDRMTVRLLAETRESTALPAELWDEIETATSPIGPLRKWRNMTQAALAEATGLSQGYLSELEHGKKTGDVATLRTIAGVLGVTLEDILTD